MEWKKHKAHKTKVMELVCDDLIIASPQFALDLMVEAGSRDSRCIMIHEGSLAPAFFELKSGLAGEIVQKAVNYHFRLIIIGEFEKYNSKSLRDFIYESNQGSTINFLGSVESALAKITKEQA